MGGMGGLRLILLPKEKSDSTTVFLFDFQRCLGVADVKKNSRFQRLSKSLKITERRLPSL